MRNVAEYRQQDPQYAMLLRQYAEAQRVAGCSAKYARMCRDDLAKYEQEHPVVTRFVSAGLRKPDAEHAALLQAVREAEAQSDADSASTRALKRDGDELHSKLTERFAATEPVRLEEAERIEAVLADPEYQQLERERNERLKAEAEQVRGVQTDPAAAPAPELEPDDQRQRRIAALANAASGSKPVNLDELAERGEPEQPRTGTGPKGPGM